MRKFLIILLAILSLALLVEVVWSIGKPMSDADRKRITAMVQAETAESIQEIEPHGNGTVLVHTGAPRGGGDGRGQLFTLRRSFGAWKIISRGTWITCG